MTDVQTSSLRDAVRVLLVDDDEGLLRLASRALQRCGHAVTTAATIARAKEAIDASVPDVIVVDYQLDGMTTGLEFLRALRARGLHIPAVLATGFADEKRVIEALRAGVGDVVPKTPDYFDFLPEAIDRVLAQARLQRELVVAAERERLLEAERAARTEAERAARVKDEFVATLSHELRTPLNAIVGWVQFLLRDASDPARVHKGLRVIDRNARLQAQMVDDLLDLSRIISGKLRLDIQPVDLRQVIDDVISSLQPAADAKEIAVSTALAETGPMQGDSSRLQQVMWNLLSNAIKFTDRRGSVRIELAQRDGSVVISVVDTGQGISPEFMPHVFERFRQADSSTTRQFGGLGLGLSIAKQLTELHGGRIRVDSAGVGLGATFTVELPVARAVQGAATGREGVRDDPTRLAGLRVLVVEDEDDARDLTRHILESLGARVTAVASTPAALAAFDLERPDVVVSDLGMPGQDGYELIRQLRIRDASLGRLTPAAALTAQARSEDRKRALMAGFQSHVAKPVDPRELSTVVAELAGRQTP
ncbi:response regulator [Pararobbsia silviterrae]|uniref:Virulence sensor protein BvgS n=1 Tax=Pararobbsia silviterrae TaxID=1792498 RepID=A0A494XEQ7_9BURK|nr:response regulator [Pararobbsia silviterrae]RKP46624.1 response regulator [Pararobbsia silviterrae]